MSMVRFWNRILSVDKNTRITKRVFMWDYRLNKNNCLSSHMECLLASIKNTAIFNLQKECDVETVRVFLNNMLAEL